MRRILRYSAPLIVAAGAAAAILSAPAAVAQPGDSSTLPACTDTGGAEAIGGWHHRMRHTRQRPNQRHAGRTNYPYPWDDEFYGPALIIGGGGGHGGR